MHKWQTLADIRREYGTSSLLENEAAISPMEQFEHWFAEVLKVEKTDPSAMVLSTCDECGYPDSRVVLLKGIENNKLVFFTNYNSHKAKQIQQTPYVSLNFHWPEMARQVRVKGTIQKIESQRSDNYFITRPLTSQVNALLSQQSSVLATRAQLEQQIKEYIVENAGRPLLRPAHWGGYEVEPTDWEFWQGRDNRCHDRLHYYQAHDAWLIERLSP
jgi:pyridoxamine 5'-phosphate oxidase